MSQKIKVGQHVGVLRGDCGGGTVLDYSGLITDVISPTTARVKFSDGTVMRILTHPDFMVSMEPAYEVVGAFLREHDTEEVTEAELVEYASARLDPSEQPRALWLLHRLAEVVS
ncbi:MAG: hypothetical protein JF592_18380 [Microbacterium sp.]|uniref:hypothetical protein n=1 Tax=Microbacterium sp. TaxID=51671 RepID=UPI001DF45D92|nr:hypothetical protein [Microbacterium sp.]MBW8764516.1 hypothetical protein [Microbacterium sp.]